MITKHRTGSLIKRGSNYYVRAMIEGKVIVRALRDEAGNAITTKPEAELARERFMAPFTLATKAEALQSLAGKLADDKAELARLEDKQNPPLLIVSAWSGTFASTRRPDTGPDTLAVYEGQFGQFQDWMAKTHPPAAALRDVTEEIAEEYAGHLNHGRLSPNTFNKHIRVLELVFRVLSKRQS